MTDEEVQVKATIWRHDGVIHYTIPPIMAVNTFVALAASHGSWLCFFMEDMAAVLDKGDVDMQLAEKYHVDIESLREGMLKSHGTSRDNVSRMKRGADDYLPGMLYGTMHPTELAALGEELTTILAMVSLSGQTEVGREMVKAWGMWIRGSEKFVRPAELLASVSGGKQDDSRRTG